MQKLWDMTFCLINEYISMKKVCHLTLHLSICHHCFLLQIWFFINKLKVNFYLLLPLRYTRVLVLPIRIGTTYKWCWKEILLKLVGIDRDPSSQSYPRISPKKVKPFLDGYSSLSKKRCYRRGVICLWIRLKLFCIRWTNTRKDVMNLYFIKQFNPFKRC